MAMMREATTRVMAEALSGSIPMGRPEWWSDESFGPWESGNDAENDYGRNPWAPEALYEAWLAAIFFEEQQRQDAAERNSLLPTNDEREHETSHFILDSGPDLSVLSEWGNFLEGGHVACEPQLLRQASDGLKTFAM
eukprot:TRINITY_DN1181_c0_g1_i1.p1 TRINITY_DN1181_c0_g1~~TRINITY_DN1181_c0_g1_i1.p1  ORF type:complete len:137 (+),score=18.54 TRINITY_DN1181_c0_g1_i1:263-673(+)